MEELNQHLHSPSPSGPTQHGYTNPPPCLFDAFLAGCPEFSGLSPTSGLPLLSPFQLLPPSHPQLSKSGDPGLSPCSGSLHLPSSLANFQDGFSGRSLQDVANLDSALSSKLSTHLLLCTTSCLPASPTFPVSSPTMLARRPGSPTTFVIPVEETPFTPWSRPTP